MPCFVTTQVGEKLSDIVGQYQSLTGQSSTKDIEEIANLNQVSAYKMLSPYKILVLPGSGSNCRYGALDFQAVSLAQSMEQKQYGPLKTLLTTGWGNELLTSLEIVESLRADGEVKEVFGGVLAASNSLFNQFLSASDRYISLLQSFVTSSGKQRNELRRQIAAAAREVEQKYQKVVAVFVKRRQGSLPKRWKEVPDVHLYHVKNRGNKATILKDLADIRRIRYAAQSARILGASALLLDIGLAEKKIKLAYDTDGNTSQVAFEEIGRLSLEAASTQFPFLLIPGVALLIVTGAAATGTIMGNFYGKKIGLAFYDNIVGPLSEVNN